MPTEAEIAAYSATNNYPPCGVRAFVQANGRLPAEDAELCQWASANGVLDSATGGWLCQDPPATSGLGAWIQANPWLAAGLVVGGLALLSKQNKRRR